MDSFFYNLNQNHYSTYLRFKTIWTIRETDWINPFDPVCGLSLITLHPVVGGLNDSDWRHKDYDPMKNLSRQLESLDWPRCWVGLGLMIIINNITISEGKNTRNKIVFFSLAGWPQTQLGLKFCFRLLELKGWLAIAKLKPLSLFI